MKKNFLAMAFCAVLLHGANAGDPPAEIRCDGVFGRHLQGVATDGKSIWWSFTVELVRTDLAGRVCRVRRVPKHHGDLCHVDGKIYVAVNFGPFNRETGGDGKVMAYDAQTLEPCGEWPVPELVHGAGGMTFANGRFYLVGGLPSTHESNYVYEYARDFTFIRRVDLPVGNTFMGIQTASYEDGELLFGVYGWKGNPPGTLHCPSDLSSVTRRRVNSSTGLVKLFGSYYVGKTSCDSMGNNARGWLERVPDWPGIVEDPVRRGGKVVIVRGEGVRYGGREVVDCGYRRGADPYRPVYVIDEPYTPCGLFPTSDTIRAVCVGARFGSAVPDLVRAVRRAAAEDETFVLHLPGPDQADDIMQPLLEEAKTLGVAVENVSRFDLPVVMGRDYWTMLSSGPYTDPARNASLTGIWENAELAALPVFRDCGLVSFSRKPPPKPETGLAAWRTVRENYPAKSSDWDALEANAKPGKPLAVVFTSKRNVLTMAGEIDLDHADYEAWKSRHPNLVSVRTLCEWGSDIMHTRNGARAVADAARRAELERLWCADALDDRYARLGLAERFVEWKKRLFYDDAEMFSAFRCAYSLDHVAAALGARWLTLETTDTTGVPFAEFRWDAMAFFVRGAARQFGLPWAWYCAIYRNGYTKDGKWTTNSTCKHLNSGLNGLPNGGVSVSLENRAWYYAYLNGANVVEPEGWSNHLIQTNATSGRIELSDRGRRFSSFHDFTVRHPKRGYTYAPVAILVPYAQGYMAQGGPAWGKCPYLPEDAAIDAVFFSLIPGFDRAAHLKRGGEGSLHNSHFAMMYDVLVPDSPQSQEDFSRVLSAYPAAILVGHYADSKRFEPTLARYVENGGELVRITPEMVPQLEPGAVRRLWAGQIEFPAVRERLQQLQERYFPFEVAGDIQYGANRTQGGWWLWCFNNRGVTKFTDAPETVDPSCVSRVSVRLKRAGAYTAVRELLAERSISVKGGVFTYDIAPGELAIFEVVQ